MAVSKPGGILVVGATSGMIRTALHLFAVDKAAFVLAARNIDRLNALAAELLAAGATAVTVRRLDVLDTAAHDDLLRTAIEHLGELDLVLVAHGALPDQFAAEKSVADTLDAFNVNATSIIALLVPVASYFEDRGAGTIAVVTSVAGERGRRENYLYGAAKSAVSTYLQGLRARLHPAGVRVVELRPGPVHTQMTEHKRGGWMFIDAKQAGRLIHRAIVQGRDIAYIPSWWRVLAALARAVPEWIFKRTDYRA